MIIKRIQYTVTSDFAETNKKNIAKVMEDLRAINSPGIRYSSYVLEDGKTFMHYVVLQDEAAGKILNDLESFQRFQLAIKNSNPEVPPKLDNLTLVGSSYELMG